MAPVWELCEGGELAELRLALVRGEDVNSIKDEEYKQTGLMLAVLEENNSIVRLLLEQPTLDLNCTDHLGFTALCAMVLREVGIGKCLPRPSF